MVGSMLRRGLVTGMLTLAISCGGVVGGAGPATGTNEAALNTDNGLTTNGLTTNGLTTNGLTTNGLTTNGLTTLAFASWFTLNPSTAPMVMRYLVRCGLPKDKSLSYSFGLTTYVWYGELGLAPTWGSGSSMPVAEQQVMSACLAAHANKYGAQMMVSIRGYYTSGRYIPVSTAESSDYPADEGCYFGNLFDGTGVFSAFSSSSPLTSSSKTSQRACAINEGNPGSCAPMVQTYRTCQQLCTGDASDISNYFEYRSCTWNGVSYRPLSVRIRNDQIATCGDGICQASESCYSPVTGNGCAADCGVCGG